MKIYSIFWPIYRIYRFLSYNLIIEIHSKVFNGLVCLETIDLRYNEIETIQENTFDA
jgi:hypothetical protein